MQKNSLSDRWKYAFDNTISKGSIVLISWLGLIAIVFVCIIAVVTWALVDRNPTNLFEQVWSSIITTIAGFDLTEGLPWLQRVSLLVIVLVNLFGVSILVGLIITGIEEKLHALRRGRSIVLETDHIVILGWSSVVFSVLSELAIANESLPDAAVVIMGNEDKVTMEEEIRTRIRNRGRTRMIVRSGVPSDMADLEIVNLNMAKSIVILSPQNENPDASVIKTLLAVTKNPNRRPEPYHIVTEIVDPKNLDIAKVVGQDEVELVLTGDLVARIIAQVCRQPGLSSIYTELFSYTGNEIYFQTEPPLTDKTFGEALLAYEDSAVIGLCRSGEMPQINPPLETRIQAGDRIILIAQDDSTIRFSGYQNVTVDEAMIRTVPSLKLEPEKILILGWNWRATTIVQQLNEYVAAGSTVTVVAQTEDAEANFSEGARELTHLTLTFQAGDITDRRLLDSLALEKMNCVIILSYSDRLDPEEADAYTLTTLLHLRDIAKRNSYNFSITSEIMNVSNEPLAQIAQVDDFIVSDRIVSSILSQIANTKMLAPVIADLLNSENAEIYLKPVENYVELGQPINFYTVVESAKRRHEVAIGYRLKKYFNDSSKAYGVVLNPNKSNRVTFAEGDRIIVVAKEYG